MGERPPLRVGVDIGGTFTDVVVVADGGYAVGKFPSTRHDPAAAVVDGVPLVVGAVGGVLGELRHGTTVATNAILEGKGARVAFLVTEGFEDLLLLARQTRPDLYALTPEPLEPPVPGPLVVGVPERVGAGGEVLRALDSETALALAERVAALGVEAAAVCLLFAHVRPDHERLLGEALEARGVAASLSHDIAPVPGEYERACTTVLNARVAPLMYRYLRRMGLELQPERFRVMAGSGTAMDADEAGRRAVDTALSGPAAGVTGAVAAARRCGFADLMTFDMGGTSTDVALVAEGRPGLTREATIGGLPLAVEVVDIHTIGAGGGSLARVDAAGVLRVGPESAGADPGPACYGGGGGATVTDANLVLGRLRADAFLGGHMVLDPTAAARSLEPLAERLGCDVAEAALGVVRVAESSMERALRRISLERGHDPRHLVLVAFGGAGPLHACALAQALGCPRVLVPPDPGALCALGAAAADEQVTLRRSLAMEAGAGGDGVPPATVAFLVGELHEEARARGVDDGWFLEPWVELRYRGQSQGFEVPWTGEPVVAGAAFRAAHGRRCGFDHGAAAAELTAVVLRCRRPLPPIPVAPPPSAGGAVSGDDIEVRFRAGLLRARRLERSLLGLDAVVDGPAVILEQTATTLLHPGCRARVLADGSLLVDVDGGAP